ncbi:unnamed protein product [Phytophthora fragariaefolia]|uniref:Unnamed protein product n=1 Tax=Phytophthora fragariaefolia TaxID=1490495 RepID=A0A9W6Y5B7_9STRA|nr:unnamed protein product [Phytophthora fragariaefolia]
MHTDELDTGAGQSAGGGVVEPRGGISGIGGGVPTTDDADREAKDDFAARLGCFSLADLATLGDLPVLCGLVAAVALPNTAPDRAGYSQGAATVGAGMAGVVLDASRIALIRPELRSMAVGAGQGRLDAAAGAKAGLCRPSGTAAANVAAAASAFLFSITRHFWRRASASPSAVLFRAAIRELDRDGVRSVSGATINAAGDADTDSGTLAPTRGTRTL